MTEMKDFTRARDQIRFRIDGDVFEACPAIPAEILLEFAARYEDAAKIEGAALQYEALSGVLKLVLLETSYSVLSKRLRDRNHPVDMDQLNDIVVWLMEQYGARPTQLSLESPDGLSAQESGMSLREPALAAALTSEPSPQTAS